MKRKIDVSSSPSPTQCDKCGKIPKTEPKGNRIPKHWKRFKEQLWCDSCWKAAYVLRAIVVPLVGPVDSKLWPEFRAALRAVWIESTRITNFITDGLYAKDVRRDGSSEKMPRMPKHNHYKDASKKFLAVLPGKTISSVLQSMQNKYMKTRYEILWTHERSLANAKYPQPFVAHNQAWSLEFRDRRPVVSVLLRERRWELILRSGREFHRQVAAMRQITSGDASPGELAIYGKRVSGTATASTMMDRSKAGARKQIRTMVKLVAWLPRPPAKERTGIMTVRTDANAMLVALDEKAKRIWIENADHLRRWTTEHARNLQRWSEDSKAEQRPVPSFAARREKAVEKQHNRMNSAMNEITAHVVKFAQRRNYAQIVYDDTCRSYVSIRWKEFSEMLERKCKENGILFIVSAEASERDAKEARMEEDIEIPSN